MKELCSSEDVRRSCNCGGIVVEHILRVPTMLQ